MKVGLLIRTRLVVAVTSLVVLMTITHSFTSYYQIKEFILNNLIDNASTVISPFYSQLSKELPAGYKDLAIFIRLAVLSKGPTILPDLVKVHKELLTIHVVTADKAVLWSEPRNSESRLLFKKADTSTLYVEDDKVTIEMKFFHQDQHYLTSYLSFSLDQLTEQRGAILRRTLITITIFVIIGYVCAYLIGYTITKPISLLTKFVTSGTLRESELVSFRNDEVGLLARKFTELDKTIIRKISDLNEAKDESDRLKSMLTNMLDSMPSQLIAVNSELEITHLNKISQQSIGVDSKSARGKLFSDLFREFESLHSEMVRALSKGIVYNSAQFEVQHKDSREVFDVMMYPLPHSRTTKAVIRIDNVTDRSQMEKLIVQSEKMISLGGLAAGMAHEINNPLGVIVQGYQNILRRLSGDTKKNREVAEECGIDLKKLEVYLQKRSVYTFIHGGNEAALRAAEIIKSMLKLSRQISAEHVSFDLLELLESAMRLGSIDYDMRKKYDFKFVDVIKDYDADVVTILGSPSELEQVFLNLFKNALQAMENIISENFKPQFRLRVKNDGGFVRVEVEDNGPGIPPETINRIFEPFFTTKPVGTGTGLGLSVSYTIITQNHGGTFEVESELGKGTTFIIRLPVKQGHN